jgi:hypothetical protein
MPQTNTGTIDIGDVPVQAQISFTPDILCGKGLLNDHTDLKFAVKTVAYYF